MTTDFTEKEVSKSGAATSNVTLRINGVQHSLQLEPRVTLLDALREYIGLTGTKKGCNHGQCGACTVLVNDRVIHSCLTFAWMHAGEEITTIEGLAKGDELHPLQAAFIKHDGFQCGYCTPGQICSAVGMLTAAQNTASAVTPSVAKPPEIGELSDAEIRERMSGNICRCGAYPGILAAIREVQGIQAGNYDGNSTASAEIKRPIDRVDGKLKATGSVTYTAEFSIPNLAYGVLVQSTIARGRVKEIDTAAAEKAPGVQGILTHKNVPRLNGLPEQFTTNGWPGETRQPLQDDVVHHIGQHLAVFVADTLERAEYAAELVKVAYDEQEPSIRLEQGISQATEPEFFFGIGGLQTSRGDAAGALGTADVKIEPTYTTPVEHHNPIETSATIAMWDGDELTLYDTSRFIKGEQKAIAQTFGVPLEKVRVVCHFMGGSFGSKGFQWGHVILAALAARQLDRPVKIVLTRQQMFTSAGHRPQTVQSLALAATKDGRLSAICHATMTHTSPVAEYTEPCGRTTKMLYACPNLEVKHKLVRLNVPTPVVMRAPGEASGMFALESAMDELAYTLKIDPVELRLKNYALLNPEDNKPWSSKFLKECYEQGMERFGWHKRNPMPRSMKDGDWLVGWGMATSTYPGGRQPASAKATIFASGQAVVSSATHEQGNGAYTIMSQIAADALGLPLEKVKFELGDSQFPQAPVTGGSWTTASVGSAVIAAAEAVKTKLLRIALADPASPLYGAVEDQIAVRDGRLFLKAEPSVGETHAAILSRSRTPVVEAEASVKPGDEREKFAIHSFGAHFVEVKVDVLLGQVRVTRFVSVFDVGRVLNLKTARSQLIGGITMGLGMALLEDTVSDPHTGRIINPNLGEYHVPVNADILDIDISFIDQPDPYINPMGARGIGELGIVGAAAAIANAVYHATGKRIRDLPITLDKLL